MAKPEWGTKRVCQSCAAKFYDFSRSPILCPNCGAAYDLEAQQRARRTKTRAKAAAAEEAEIAETDEEDEELVDLEDDDDLIENADELGDDEDVGKVVVDDDSEDED